MATQVGNMTNNLKVEIDWTIPEFSTTKIFIWDFLADDFAKERYDMVLGKYILIELLLNIKVSGDFIKADDGPLKWS